VACFIPRRGLREMSMLRDLWRGLYPLPRAFWGFYVFGGFAALILFTAFASSIVFAAPRLRPAVYVLGLCAVWTYWGIASVGVWRSADAYARAFEGGAPLWPVTAKLVVGAAGLWFFGWLIMTALPLGP
jgi:hypothetical protein